jgi:hypothetical protein
VRLERGKNKFDAIHHVLSRKGYLPLLLNHYLSAPKCRVPRWCLQRSRNYKNLFTQMKDCMVVARSSFLRRISELSTHTTRHCIWKSNCEVHNHSVWYALVLYVLQQIFGGEKRDRETPSKDTPQRITQASERRTDREAENQTDTRTQAE